MYINWRPGKYIFVKNRKVEITVVILLKYRLRKKTKKKRKIQDVFYGGHLRASEYTTDGVFVT